MKQPQPFKRACKKNASFIKIKSEAQQKDAPALQGHLSIVYSTR